MAERAPALAVGALPDCTYIGFRSGAAAIVTVRSEAAPERAPLPPRLDLANHSPDGFEWGYGGSGPAQLALALIAHATGDDERALALHQQFKAQVIANWPRSGGWKISSADVRLYADLLESVELSRLGGS